MDRIAEAVASRIGHRAHSQGASKRNNGLITSTGVPALDEISEFPVRRGHLVEVVGASSSGKTQILHTVAAKSLTELGNGHSVKVCWFDLNGGFDEQRLRKIITEKGNLNGNGTNRSGTSDLLRRFSVYYPKTTAAMCASLQQLPDFVRTPEGAAVDTVVIDALGSFHYLDKFEMEEVKDRTKGQVPSESKELVLAKVVRDILQLCKVTIFVSKCSLYDEEALPCLWPFPAAGVPRMPRDFMPALWSSIVSHVLLVYSVKGNAATEESCTRRGVVSLTVTHSEGKGSLRKLTVRVGTTMVYNDKGIFLDGSVHKA